MQVEEVMCSPVLELVLRVTDGEMGWKHGRGEGSRDGEVAGGRLMRPGLRPS